MHSGWRGLPSRPRASRGVFRPYPITPPPFPAGRSERLGDQPDPANLPPLPTFTPTGGPLLSPGPDALGADGSEQQPKGIPNSDPQGSLHSSGPYNPAPTQVAPASQLQSTPSKPGAPQEVCRSFNVNRCRFSRCRYSHVCAECGGAHAALNCPHKQSTSTGRGPTPRSRFPPRARQQHPHPYLLPPNGTGLPEQL